MNLSKVNSLTIEAYNKLAQKYHEAFKDEMKAKEYDRLILDNFSKLLNSKGIICDAGCGPSGHVGKYLQRKGHEVIGIDISPNCIKIASQYEPEIKFMEMDMMNSSFEPNSFDGIISFYSIIHTPKKEVVKILKEFNRILKPEGRLLMVVKKGSKEGIINDDWYEGNKIYFANFIEEELIEYLKFTEFEIDFINTRTPYESEIAVERIYIIGKKSVVHSC